MIYLIFLSIIILTLVLGLDKRITLTRYIQFPLIILSLITGLRFETGSDYESYRLVYDWILHNYDTDFEISYVLLCQFVQLIHGNFQLVVFIYATITYYFMYCALKEYCNTKLEVAAFVCCFYSLMFSTYFIIMRQFLAASIFLYAFSVDKTRTKYSLFLLATFVHYGSAVIIPLYIFFTSQLFNKSWKYLVILMFAILLGRGDFSFLMISKLTYLFPRYDYYIDKTNYGVLGSVSIIIVLITLVYFFMMIVSPELNNEKIERKHLKALNNGVLISLVIYYSTLTLGWFHRAYWYTYIFAALLPSLSSILFNKEKDRAIIISIFIFIMVCYSIYYFLELPNSETNMFPYRWSAEFF